eukprot:238800_1
MGSSFSQEKLSVSKDDFTQISWWFCAQMPSNLRVLVAPTYYKRIQPLLCNNRQISQLYHGTYSIYDEYFIRNILLFVSTNIKYEKGSDKAYLPWKILQQRKGVCLEFANLTVTLMRYFEMFHNVPTSRWNEVVQHNNINNKKHGISNGVMDFFVIIGVNKTNYEECHAFVEYQKVYIEPQRYPFNAEGHFDKSAQETNDEYRKTYAIVYRYNDLKYEVKTKDVALLRAAQKYIATPAMH